MGTSLITFPLLLPEGFCQAVGRPRDLTQSGLPGAGTWRTWVGRDQVGVQEHRWVSNGPKDDTGCSGHRGTTVRAAESGGWGKLAWPLHCGRGLEFYDRGLCTTSGAMLDSLWPNTLLTHMTTCQIEAARPFPGQELGLVVRLSACSSSLLPLLI